jgi:hypothetical protein
MGDVVFDSTVDGDGPTAGIVDEKVAEDNKALWLVGIGLEICAAFSGTMGKQMLRKAAMLKAEGNLKRGKCILVAGLCLEMSVGPLLDMAAYAFAPQARSFPPGSSPAGLTCIPPRPPYGSVITESVAPAWFKSSPGRKYQDTTV